MISVDKPHLYVTAVTNPGMKGKNNEDRYMVAAHRMGSKGSTSSLLMMISDGVGGHRAGEVAADIAVETIGKAVAQSDGQQPLQTLGQAIRSASNAISAQSEKDSAQRGMGATCVCAWVIGDQLYVAWVGDSRIYRLRGDTIIQLTTDHTWVQEAIEYGALTPEQARNHPNAHVIRRYLGSTEPIEPDFRLRLAVNGEQQPSEANQGMRLLPGDRLLLCSDGLTDLVKPEEIQAALSQHEQSQALRRLVNLANERGGHDNITIIAAEVPPSRYPTIPLKKNSPSGLRLGLILFIAVLLFVILALLSFVGLMVLEEWRESTATPTDPVVSTEAPAIKPTLLPTDTPLPTITLTPLPSATLTPWPVATTSITSPTPDTPTPTPTLTKSSLSIFSIQLSDSND